MICALLTACGGDGTSDSAAVAATRTPMDGPGALPQLRRPVSVPLSISGKPGTQASVGQAYTFTPTTSGPVDATLSFSIQNKPAWGAFSISTGQLSGTPSAADVGTSAAILISVSDGTASASLTSFSIVVPTTGGSTPGSATLSWSAPTTNTDGAALTDLAGYTLRYGSDATALNQSVQIANASTTSYTLSNLAAGTWFFALNAYTSSGAQSAATPVVSLAVP